MEIMQTHGLYINDEVYSEEEMYEWLSSLTYTYHDPDFSNPVIFFVIIRDETYDRYDDSTYAGLISAIDLSQERNGSGWTSTGEEGYLLFAGWDGLNGSQFKLIYSTIDCDDVEYFGEVKKGWQGVTYISWIREENYIVTSTEDDQLENLKSGIFSWWSWIYN